jgi:hypothetical protein
MPPNPHWRLEPGTVLAARELPLHGMTGIMPEELAPYGSAGSSTPKPPFSGGAGVTTGGEWAPQQDERHACCRWFNTAAPTWPLHHG